MRDITSLGSLGVLVILTVAASVIYGCKVSVPLLSMYWLRC